MCFQLCIYNLEVIAFSKNLKEILKRFQKMQEICSFAQNFRCI